MARQKKPKQRSPRDRVTDAKRDDKTKPGLAPLLLLPLSLEYRFVSVRTPVVVKDTAKLREELAALKGPRIPRSLSARKKAEKERLEIFKRERARTTSFVPPKLSAREELWVRWYPDESFSENEVAPISEDEAQAKQVFEQAVGGRKWWDLSQDAVNTAWQAFAQSVGAYRAVHLMRQNSEDTETPSQNRIGRIAALPAKIGLFAVKDDVIEKIAEGAPIPQNKKSEPSLISYTPDAADPGGWLIDFETAVSNGMGVKISDPEMLKRARTADWIIALGLSGRRMHDEFADLLKSHIATGEFALLPQDSPTNNTPDALSYLTRPEQALPAFTRRATALEQDAFAAGQQYGSDLLSEAFNLPADLLRQAVDSNDSGFEDAKAMLRVIGPALLDDSLDGLSQIDGVSEDAFIEAMAATISARGALPAVRFGDNAMGILPITQVGDLKFSAEEQETTAGKVQAFLSKYARVARNRLPSLADEKVSVITPGDPEAADKLYDILTTVRVSKRIDVSDAPDGADKVKSLGCPYVTGRRSVNRPQRYLQLLRTEPRAELPDPDSRNRTWPLLYRLARMSLERNTNGFVFKELVGKPGNAISPEVQRNLSALNGLIAQNSLRSLLLVPATDSRFAVLNAGKYQLLRRINLSFSRALVHLESVAARPRGHAQLEMLLCEVIDLFQHRIDAFATGLAYARVQADRQAGAAGLFGGYYGMIGQLREASKTGNGDGYLQAPSVPQAVTAALLRSAYMRHRDGGAFEINLSSNRTRRALRLLDLIAKGHDLQEGLGLRGERWLHEARKDQLILKLRAAYPLTVERGANVAVRRVFNGLDFLQDAPAGADLKRLHVRLSDDLDALSDIVVAEAVHQRALGQPDAANAWLKVLSGHPPPGLPVFLKTQRHGQGSSYRANLLLEESAPNDRATPRSIAEPSLAAFADRVMPEFHAVVLEFDGFEGANGNGTLKLSLVDDLDMQPIDLVIGGASELHVRVRSSLARKLNIDPKDLPRSENNNGVLRFSSEAINELFVRADLIRTIAKSGRPMEAGDLNASANIKFGELTETQSIAALHYSLVALHNRISLLATRLNAELMTLRHQLTAFETAILEWQRCIDAGEPQAALDRCLAQAELHRQKLMTALWPVAAYGQPDALRFFTSQQALDDPRGFFGRLEDMVRRLSAASSGLRQSLQDFPASGHTTLSTAKAALEGCCAALRQALDGEAMIILPPLERSAGHVAPVLGGATTLNAGLEPWLTHRPNLVRLNVFQAATQSLSAFEVQDIATIMPGDPQADPRPEGVAPPVRHKGVYLSTPGLATETAPVCGIVCDEWTVEQPSETQMAGIAINYDSPGAEAPNCLLLGVPANHKVRSWNEGRAAEIVVEAINWMKIRALSSYDRITPTAQLPGANILSGKTVGDSTRARIPVANLFTRLAGLDDSGFSVLALDADSFAKQKTARATQLNERSGFRQVRE